MLCNIYIYIYVCVCVFKTNSRKTHRDIYMNIVNAYMLLYACMYAHLQPLFTNGTGVPIPVLSVQHDSQ